jgi:uncharacterized protein (DUF1697 family)
VPPRTFIALLRAINLGSHNKVPMPALRMMCQELGWLDVRTYIQSGNVVFRAACTAATAEADLEEALASGMGIRTPVLVRDATQWQRFVAANPFTQAAERTPNLVMLGLARRKMKTDAAELLQARAADGEEIVQDGEALWIHYAGGSGRSKLSPALLERAAGSPVTTRNWRTVLELGRMTNTAG